MNQLRQALLHINVSMPIKISQIEFISCIKGDTFEKKWVNHIKAFIHETPISLIHAIILDGFFSFKELYEASIKWDSEGYSNEETNEWIKEMYFLSVGKAHELGIDRFI